MESLLLDFYLKIFKLNKIKYHARDNGGLLLLEKTQRMLLFRFFLIVTIKLIGTPLCWALDAFFAHSVWPFLQAAKIRNSTSFQDFVVLKGLNLGLWKYEITKIVN